VRWPRFVIFDVAGALLWTATFLGIGYIFHRELAMVALWLGQFAWVLAVLLLLLIPAAYIGFKYRQKQKFLRVLASERIAPEEVLKQIEAGGNDHRSAAPAGLPARSANAAFRGAHHAAGTRAEVSGDPARPRGHPLLHLTERSQQRPGGA
jgi:hypothetical protein